MTLLLAYDCSVIGLILNECTSNRQTVQADIMSSQGDIKPTKSLWWFNATISWHWVVALLAFLITLCVHDDPSSGWPNSASLQKTLLIQTVQVRYFCIWFKGIVYWKIPNLWLSLWNARIAYSRSVTIAFCRLYKVNCDRLKPPFVMHKIK